MEILDDMFSIVQPLYFILAYAGMLIHEIVKMGELSNAPDFHLFNGYLRKNIFSMVASILMIPVILIIASGESVKDLLPLNNVTSVLAGWQTQSIFMSLMSVFGNRRLKKNTDDNTTQV